MKRTMRLEGATALLIASLSGGAVHAAMDPGGVIENYADIAHAMYEDSLNAAQELDARIGALLDTPGAETLSAARTAWLNSRVPYMHTEVYRFGNVIVDDWEGKVNAWPLDEGLIDYVDPGYGAASDENPLYVANVVGHDMGEGLADHRADGVASGREWRTPPLWGIGLTEQVSGHSRFLHDGRARGLLEAVLWHGGEAEAAREAVVRMSDDEREALLAFMRSL